MLKLKIKKSPKETREITEKRGKIQKKLYFLTLKSCFFKLQISTNRDFDIHVSRKLRFELSRQKLEQFVHLD